MSETTPRERHGWTKIADGSRDIFGVWRHEETGAELEVDWSAIALRLNGRQIELQDNAARVSSEFDAELRYRLQKGEPALAAATLAFDDIAHRHGVGGTDGITPTA